MSDKRNLTLKAGCLAYLDTFSCGLVPCKVLHIREADLPGAKRADVRITGTRGYFCRGEIEKDWRASAVVPRGAVYKRRGEYFPRILPFHIEVTP